MTGSASAQGVPTAAVKVVGGSGGGGTKKVRFRAPQAHFLQFVPTYRDSQKAPGAAEAHRFLKNKGPVFGSFFYLRQFGVVKHNGLGTFVFLIFFLICLELSKNVRVRSFALLAPAGHF